MVSNETKIVIIGAGLTGLLMAHALKKRGFNDVTVYEREQSIDARRRDWTILVHWGLPILNEILPEALAAKVPNTASFQYAKAEESSHLPTYDGMTGDIKFKIPIAGGLRITRQKLRRVLVEGVDIRWGKTLKGMVVVTTEEDKDGKKKQKKGQGQGQEPNNNSNSNDDEMREGGSGSGSGSRLVRLTFADGEMVEADILVGADGVSSKLRELLFGAEAARAQSAGLTFATACMKYGDAKKVETLVGINPLTALIWLQNGFGGCGVLDAPDPLDKSTWITFWVRVWAGADTLKGREAIDYVQEHTKGVWEPFQKLIDWTPKDSTCDADPCRYWITQAWDSYGGRVSLVGDAAHPMLPFRGQALQHSISDVQGFVNALCQVRDAPRRGEAGETGDDDTETMAGLRRRAVEDFNADVVQRGASAVRQSLKEGEKSLNVETVGTMQMATTGIAKTA